MIVLPVYFILHPTFIEQQSVKVMGAIPGLQNNSSCYTSDPATRSMCISFQKVLNSLGMVVSVIWKHHTLSSFAGLRDIEPHIGLLLDLRRKSVHEVISEHDRHSFS